MGKKSISKKGDFKMDKLIYQVVLLEDGIRSYDCCLCGKSFLESIDIENHIEEHKRKIIKELKDG